VLIYRGSARYIKPGTLARVRRQPSTFIEPPACPVAELDCRTDLCAQASTLNGIRFSSSLSLLVRDVGLFPQHVFLVLSYAYVDATNKSRTRGSECLCCIWRTLSRGWLDRISNQSPLAFMFDGMQKKRTSSVLLSPFPEMRKGPSRLIQIIMPHSQQTCDVDDELSLDN
jgi:hypothetical protein